jgi:hypothetical protein
MNPFHRGEKLKHRDIRAVSDGGVPTQAGRLQVPFWDTTWMNTEISRKFQFHIYLYFTLEKISL